MALPADPGDLHSRLSTPDKVVRAEFLREGHDFAERLNLGKLVSIEGQLSDLNLADFKTNVVNGTGQAWQGVRSWGESFIKLPWYGQAVIAGFVLGLCAQAVSFCEWISGASKKRAAAIEGMDAVYDVETSLRKVRDRFAAAARLLGSESASQDESGGRATTDELKKRIRGYTESLQENELQKLWSATRAFLSIMDECVDVFQQARAYCDYSPEAVAMRLSSVNAILDSREEIEARYPELCASVNGISAIGFSDVTISGLKYKLTRAKPKLGQVNRLRGAAWEHAERLARQ